MQSTSVHMQSMRRNSMHLQRRLAVLSAVILGMTNGPSQAQGVGTYFAPQKQIIAIRAGRLFDSRSGTIQNNQIVLIVGDRITDVGATVQVPAGARMLDLGSATVLPGMIDTHVHVNTGGNTQAQRALRALANAQIDLAAGFTAVLDMDSRGSFYTVDLRDAINVGNVQGPRMQVVGQSINQRATNYYPDAHSVRFYDGFTEGKNVNSPWLARTAVREAKLHRVDYIKIYTTQELAGTVHMWKPDATLVNRPSLTLEEVEAIVEEAHRLGLKVACHAYGGATNWNVMSKFIMFGMPLSQIIACATVNAARVFPSFDDRGTLNVGAPADVAIMELREGSFDFLDNYKGTRTGRHGLFPGVTVLAGKSVPRA